MLFAVYVCLFIYCIHHHHFRFQHLTLADTESGRPDAIKITSMDQICENHHM